MVQRKRGLELCREVDRGHPLRQGDVVQHGDMRHTLHGIVDDMAERVDRECAEELPGF
jgi:hypothetical protein